LWLEGINDLADGRSATEVIQGIEAGARLIRAKNIRLIQGTLPPTLGAPNVQYGSRATDAQRQIVNSFIRTSPLFDHVVDFAKAISADGGELKNEFKPNSTTAQADGIHPNRVGYLAMANAVNITTLIEAALGYLSKPAS